MANEIDVVDWNEALESVGGDEELLRDVIEAFQIEAPDLLGRIAEAIDNSSARDLERAAHTLKGSLRYFGANVASDIATRLETMGRNGELAEAADASSKLNASLQAVLDRLSKYQG